MTAHVFEAATPVTLREHATSLLREALMSGRLVPGDRVNEVELAAAIGVSRGTLREAIRGLEQEGLVVSVPRRGVFVRKLGPEEAQEISEVRMSLEITAARRIALGRLDDVRDELEARYADLVRLRDEPFPVRLRADLAFHEAICAAGGNSALLKVWQTLMATVTAMLLTVGPDDAVRLLEPSEHLQLLEAVESGDPARIERVWREHFRYGVSYIVDHLHTDGQPGKPNSRA
jgi:DNA-binding GntR family transcriptional regulator